MRESTDRELVQRAQQGDKAALGELFSRYWRAARAVAFGLTREFASAEDAAAEAFHQALANLDSLRDPSRFAPWLRTIVIRKARVHTPESRPAIDAAGELLSPDPHPDEALHQAQSVALIQQVVRRLPDTLREAVALVYFEGYSPEAAARFLEIPDGTLRRRLHEARTRMAADVRHILQGGKPMKEERERQIQDLERMIQDGATYQAMRGLLEFRPSCGEWIDKLIGQQGPAPIEQIRGVLAPYPPPHAVSSVAAAIRKALPDFHEWDLDPAAAATRFFSPSGKIHDRLQAVLPPGFAEGRPGAFLRASRAIVTLKGEGATQSIFETLQDSSDEHAFQSRAGDFRLSEVLDLTWMAPGPLELRSVQELLERLASAVLPLAPMRFSIYDEPRYRAALQLQLGAIAARAASGGVLTAWPGRPDHVDAAHVRIFLEPWATLQSGGAVPLRSLPVKR